MTYRLARSTPERLWSSFVRDGSGCWIWTRQLNNKGYGLISIQNRKRAAHIIFYEIVVGPVPLGLELDHLCNVTACVNPSHLEPVSHAENQRRGGERQLRCRRAGHPRTEENIYITKQGKRLCLLCRREYDRKRSPRRKKVT
jgi:hypothetical protein